MQPNIINGFHTHSQSMQLGLQQANLVIHFSVFLQTPILVPTTEPPTVTCGVCVQTTKKNNKIYILFIDTDVQRVRRCVCSEDTSTLFPASFESIYNTRRCERTCRERGPCCEIETRRWYTNRAHQELHSTGRRLLCPLKQKRNTLTPPSTDSVMGLSRPPTIRQRTNKENTNIEILASIWMRDQRWYTLTAQTEFELDRT